MRGDEQAKQSGATCAATRKGGEPCRARARADGFCAFHSPALATRRAEGRADGGRASGQARRKPAPAPHAAPPDDGRATTVPPATAAELTAFLGRVLADVRDGRLDPRAANALGYVARAFTEALTAGRLTDEINAVKQMLQETEDDPGGGWPRRPEGDEREEEAPYHNGDAAQLAIPGVERQRDEGQRGAADGAGGGGGAGVRGREPKIDPPPSGIEQSAWPPFAPPPS